MRIPFGIAQMGKSFRNEITPRNFTFRSREFEQMEIEFFCHPSTSPEWYRYWRDRRYQWYVGLGLAGERLRLRDHDKEELSHYSCGTADIEYAFPFLSHGEFGELEGVAHRGDFDLRSHSEGKLVPQGDQLVVELDADGKPRHRGSGKDLSYFDDQTKERFIPHVIEPSAGADRATLAFLCEAYNEDEAPDENGKPAKRVFLKLHPRLAPIKAAVFPLVKKDGMPEVAREIYKTLKPQMPAFYDEKGAVGRRYRRQDEVGTPFCITVDSQTLDRRHGDDPRPRHACNNGSPQGRVPGRFRERLKASAPNRSHRNASGTNVFGTRRVPLSIVGWLLATTRVVRPACKPKIRFAWLQATTLRASKRRAAHGVCRIQRRQKKRGHHENFRNSLFCWACC